MTMKMIPPQQDSDTERTRREALPGLTRGFFDNQHFDNQSSD